MPDAAPVTNAVFPASSFMRILPVQADSLAPKRQVSPDAIWPRFQAIGKRAGCPLLGHFTDVPWRADDVAPEGQSGRWTSATWGPLL